MRMLYFVTAFMLLSVRRLNLLAQNTRRAGLAEALNADGPVKSGDSGIF